MKKIFNTYFIFMIVMSATLYLTAVCVDIERKSQIARENEIKQYKTALSNIFKAGKIRMITQNTPNSYYIYRDQPMGFEYELAKEFAGFLQVDLEVITPSWDDMLDYLDMDKGDFVASGVTITEDREKNMLFSQPYMDVEQKFIYHKSKLPIQSIKELSGRAIHVSRNSNYHRRLIELKNSGIDIDMVVHDELSTEELIRMVSNKENDVDYTVSDSHIAYLHRRYYPDISIGISIKHKEHLGWAVRKGNNALSDKMVQFFDIIKHNGVFNRIYEKYYGHLGTKFEYSDLKAFHKDVETRLPKYQKMIMRESERHGFDWRIIAALIYQESRFDPTARSYTGVRGLMQVTEKAAKDMGISNRRDPIQNVKAGINYLNYLYLKFNDIHDTVDRIKFTLASYNIGYGHILDAQEIARIQGLDAKRWESINKTLPLLSKRGYYRKAKYGYTRGHESIRYINRVFAYYDILKQKANSEG